MCIKVVDIKFIIMVVEEKITRIQPNSMNKTNMNKIQNKITCKEIKLQFYGNVLPNCSTNSSPTISHIQHHTINPNHHLNVIPQNIPLLQSNHSCHPPKMLPLSIFFHIHFLLIIKAWIIKPIFHHSDDLIKVLYL